MPITAEYLKLQQTELDGIIEMQNRVKATNLSAHNSYLQAEQRAAVATAKRDEVRMLLQQLVNLGEIPPSF